MKLTELFGFLGLGIPVGLLLLALLGGKERVPVRRKVTVWCIQVGGISVLVAIVAFVTNFELGPSKAALGIIYVGLPAFTAGLLLRVFAPAKTGGGEQQSSCGDGSSNA